MAKKDEELFLDEAVETDEAEVVTTSRDLVGDLVIGEGLPSKAKKAKAEKPKKEAKPRKKKAKVEETDAIEEEVKEEEKPEKVEKPHVKRWFAVNVASGYEKKVKVNLEKRIEFMNMSERIFRVEIPQKTVTQVKAGKKTEKDEKVFPGYVLVEMLTNDDDAWYVVRQTAGVTGFAGTKHFDGKRNLAIPLKESEVKKILGRATTSAPQKIELDVKIGEKVRITDGPFTEMVGDIIEVYPDKSKLKVNISIFGRETPVELEYKQIQKL